MTVQNYKYMCSDARLSLYKINLCLNICERLMTRTGLYNFKITLDHVDNIIFLYNFIITYLNKNASPLNK